MAKKLIILYQEMADLTKPECVNNCKLPLSCCSSEYCMLAENVANIRYKEDISHLKTDHPTLMFMGKDGCVCPPHYRPLCTLHTCAISSFGHKPNDSEWTKKYFKLRNKIEKAEE